MSLPEDIPFKDKEKEKEPKPDTQIRINVKGLDNTIVQFKLKKHVALGKLMKSYCERKNLAIENIRFFFDNMRIQNNSTPLLLGIEDDDTIDIVSKQDGGGKDDADSSSGANDSKPDTQIRINVKGLDNTIVQYKLKKHVPLGKLMKNYCERKNLASENIRFLYEHTRVQKESTPLSMAMEDNDTLDIYREQDGGGKDDIHDLPDIEDLEMSSTRFLHLGRYLDQSGTPESL